MKFRLVVAPPRGCLMSPRCWAKRYFADKSTKKTMYLRFLALICVDLSRFVGKYRRQASLEHHQRLNWWTFVQGESRVRQTCLIGLCRAAAKGAIYWTFVQGESRVRQTCLIGLCRATPKGKNYRTQSFSPMFFLPSCNYRYSSLLTFPVFPVNKVLFSQTDVA